jgi:hypothetical protein
MTEYKFLNKNENFNSQELSKISQPILKLSQKFLHKQAKLLNSYKCNLSAEEVFIHDINISNFDEGEFILPAYDFTNVRRKNSLKI